MDLKRRGFLFGLASAVTGAVVMSKGILTLEKPKLIVPERPLPLYFPEQVAVMKFRNRVTATVKLEGKIYRIGTLAMPQKMTPLNRFVHVYDAWQAFKLGFMLPLPLIPVIADDRDLDPEDGRYPMMYDKRLGTDEKVIAAQSVMTPAQRAGRKMEDWFHEEIVYVTVEEA